MGCGTSTDNVEETDLRRTSAALRYQEKQKKIDRQRRSMSHVTIEDESPRHSSHEQQQSNHINNPEEEEEREEELHSKNQNDASLVLHCPTEGSQEPQTTLTPVPKNHPQHASEQMPQGSADIPGAVRIETTAPSRRSSCSPGNDAQHLNVSTGDRAESATDSEAVNHLDMQRKPSFAVVSEEPSPLVTTLTNTYLVLKARVTHGITADVNQFHSEIADATPHMRRRDHLRMAQWADAMLGSQPFIPLEDHLPLAPQELQAAFLRAEASRAAMEGPRNDSSDCPLNRAHNKSLAEMNASIRGNSSASSSVTTAVCNPAPPARDSRTATNTNNFDSFRNPTSTSAKTLPARPQCNTCNASIMQVGSPSIDTTTSK